MGNAQATRASQGVGRVPSTPIDIRSVRYLVFSVGSIRGIAHIGAIRQLYALTAECVDHPGFAGAAGVSAGAMAALGVAVGASADLLCELLRKSFEQSLISELQLRVTCGRMSLVSSARLAALVEDLLVQTGYPRDVTLGELHARTGFDLRMLAWNVRTQQQEIFSHALSPDVRAVDATLASSAMHALFPPRELGPMRCYVDGIQGSIMPFRQFPVEQTLAIFLFDTMRSASQTDPLFSTLTPRDRDRMVSVDVSRFSFLRFRLKPHEVRELERLGAHAVALHFSVPPVELAVRTE